MIIRNKKDFYELYKKRAFGNRALAWDSLEELNSSDHTGDICIRGIGMPREWVKYNVPRKNTQIEIEILKQKKFPIEKLRFNEAMPDHNLLIQGEIRLSHSHIDLTYTTLKKPMNQGLKEEELHTNGLQAIHILKSNFYPSSYADLQVLLEKYPNSVIEFSTYSCQVGEIPGRNTVIWEVRNY